MRSTLQSKIDSLDFSSSYSDTPEKIERKKRPTTSGIKDDSDSFSSPLVINYNIKSKKSKNKLFNCQRDSEIQQGLRNKIREIRQSSDKRLRKQKIQSLLKEEEEEEEEDSDEEEYDQKNRGRFNSSDLKTTSQKRGGKDTLQFTEDSELANERESNYKGEQYQELQEQEEEEDQDEENEEQEENKEQYFANKARQFQQEIDESEDPTFYEQIQHEKDEEHDEEYRQYQEKRREFGQQVENEIKNQHQISNQEELQAQNYNQQSQLKKDNYEEIEDRIKKLEENLQQTYRGDSYQYSAKDNSEQPQVSRQLEFGNQTNQNPFFSVQPPQKAQQQDNQFDTYQNNYSSIQHSATPKINNFDKFERDAHSLNEKVAQIKRDLEEDSSSSSSDDGKEKLKSKYEVKQQDLQRQRVKDVELVQEKKKQFHQQKMQKDLIIQNLEKEKKLLKQISDLKNENAYLKIKDRERSGSRSPRIDQSKYNSRETQPDFYYENTNNQNKGGNSANNFYLQRGNSNISPARKTRSGHSRSKSRDYLNNTPQFSNVPFHEQKHVKKTSKIDEDMMKLEKELELYKTVERIRSKLKKSIVKKINEQKIIEKHRAKMQREEQKKMQYQQSQQHNHSSNNFFTAKTTKRKTSRNKSPYSQQSQSLKNLMHTPQNKHCENCAFLLNKGIPTSFCSCDYSQKK